MMSMDAKKEGMDRKNKALVKEPYPFLLIAAVAFIVLVFLFVLTTRVHTVTWDEAVYLGMGRAILTGGDAGLWEEIRPPLLPLLFSPFSLSRQYVLYAELILFFITLACMFTLYALVKRLFNQTIAGLSALLLAMNSVFILESIQFHTAILALLFIFLSLYLLLRTDLKHQYFLVGFTAALAVLARFPSGLLYPILIASVLMNLNQAKKQAWSEKKDAIFKITLGFLIPLLMFAIVNVTLYRENTATLVDAAFKPLLLGSEHQFNSVYSVDGKIINLLYYPLSLFKVFPLTLLIIVPLFSLFAKVIQHKFSPESKALGYITIPLIIFLGYFTLIPNKQLRFSILFIGFMSVLTAYTMYTIVQGVKKNEYSMFSGASIFFLSLLILFTVGVTASAVVQHLNYFPAEQSPEVSKYYGFFTQNNIRDATILTTDPVFVAYDQGRNKFIPFYEDETIAFQKYEQASAFQEYDYIVYHPGFYPCSNRECERKKQQLEQKILLENDLMMRYEEDSEHIRYILKRKKG